MIVNVAGESVADYVEVARRLDGVPGVAGIELNISCPNVGAGGLQFAIDAEAAGAVTAAVRRATDLPLLVKLSPNVADVRPIARAIADAGADALTAINTLSGIAVAPGRARPLLGNVYGGLSGPAIKPVALRVVYEVGQVVDIPIVAIGGVTELADVLDFLAVGAVAVQVGTAIFADPTLPVRLVDELAAECRRRGLARYDALVGTALPEARLAPSSKGVEYRPDGTRSRSTRRSWTGPFVSTSGRSSRRQGSRAGLAARPGGTCPVRFRSRTSSRSTRTSPESSDRRRIPSPSTSGSSWMRSRPVEDDEVREGSGAAPRDGMPRPDVPGQRGRPVPGCHHARARAAGAGSRPCLVEGPHRSLVCPATGANLETVVVDAATAVLKQGLPWLDAMSDPRQVLRALRERPDQNDPSGKPKEMYGGTLESPNRWQKIGALAAALGDRALLAEAVAAMSEQDYWNDWPEDLETLRVALAGMS